MSQLRRLRALDGKVRRRHHRVRLKLLRHLVATVPVCGELRREEFNRIRRLSDLLDVSADAVLAECLRVGLTSIECEVAADAEGPPASGPRLKQS